MLRIIRRLFAHTPPNPVEFWSARAQDAGTFSVMWRNAAYNAGAQRDQWAAIMHHLPAERGAILDLGCGTGRLSKPLAELFANYTGVDLPEMVTEARRRNPEVSGEYVAATVQSYEFPANRFDLVLAMACLSSACRADEMPEAARCISDSLKPGGKLVMLEPFHTLPVLTRTCRMNARKVIRLFTQHGMKLDEWSGAHFIPVRLLFARPTLARMPILTRFAYDVGEKLTRLAPRRFGDYIVIALTKG